MIMHYKNIRDLCKSVYNNSIINYIHYIMPIFLNSQCLINHIMMDYAMSYHYCVECTLNVSIKPGKARFEQKRAVKHI